MHSMCSRLRDPLSAPHLQFICAQSFKQFVVSQQKYDSKAFQEVNLMLSSVTLEVLRDFSGPDRIVGLGLVVSSCVYLGS